MLLLTEALLVAVSAAAANGDMNLIGCARGAIMTLLELAPLKIMLVEPAETLPVLIRSPFSVPVPYKEPLLVNLPVTFKLLFAPNSILPALPTFAADIVCGLAPTNLSVEAWPTFIDSTPLMILPVMLTLLPVWMRVSAETVE
ncbi:hypothetical protein RP726_11900 [Candidatus Methylospira mobilis]|uniref:hypothetical protein n=1 Tax=Candidatus Methylospira mobilis TaxID=1808979 RepID=UPI0018854633|nr:hypothetical protein [Candidatus Methylospira mobilis]WNV03172.1 hypothetical protein RP726_11900 [Candidatus Methylospira mobilis]